MRSRGLVVAIAIVLAVSGGLDPAMYGRPVPVTVPPVPAPMTTWVRRPAVSRQISGPVVS